MRVPAAMVGLAAVMAARAQPQLQSAQIIPQWLERPVAVTHAPGDLARLFVVEQEGIVRVIWDGTLLPTPFIDLTGVVMAVGGEQGLLGLAFAPDYESSHHFYVSYTGPEPSGDTIVERYSASVSSPNLADPGSAQVVLRIQRGVDYHNGGWIAFGPDGHLYVASGDGGTGCVQSKVPQSTHSLLGKLLRIDVSTTPYSIPAGNPYASGGGAPEVWAYGLRNPWRNGFDRQTGDLWIADVGAGAEEEVNFQPAAAAILLAANYGWDCREGLLCASGPPSNCGSGPCPIGCASLAFTDPIHTLTHNGQICAIVGGYVYRGCAVPELRGAYFFADACTGQVWSLRYANGVVTELTEWTAQLAPPGWTSVGFPSSFGEDAMGELYLTELGNGVIFKIIPAVPPPDCNENGRPDGCDIAGGFSPDINSNGIPDECEELCYADCTGEGSLTVADFGCFQGKYVLGDPYADCNASGSLTVADFGCFQTKFVLGCP